jgi:prolyl-tRNA synthetase
MLAYIAGGAKPSGAKASASAGGAKAGGGATKGGAEMKKETLLGIAHKKEENFADWYTQVREKEREKNCWLRRTQS